MNKRGIALFRKSKFYPEPVLCCIKVVVDGEYVNADRQLDTWRNEFIGKFPEFKDATFSKQDVEVI